ncbi:MAG TPA: UDP-N-acetylmuramoyl-L-alanyl-D-glutamate--2,6-diaminopimelate ligase [Stellaceae bacterium]|nr:UDP-N-acetylmuramoyl-L-alanyl-D-glutamate--2,6-diaminopimelate ligase [Stellaceae bacterium]
MKITELAGEEAAPSGGNPEIAGLSADSRAVGPGFLFAALPGTRHDGRKFAQEAVAKGAVAILTDDPAALALDADSRHRVVLLADPNPGRRLALFAARFYGRQPRAIAAVTGTNGKTSVAHFTREIWTAEGQRAASLGTLGVVTAAGRRPGALTTPDPVALHRELAALAAAGIDHAALEASSHGLQQFRLDGVRIAAAAFTNLTRDHLDYHGDMARYRAAKERLFGELLGEGRPAVLNADSDEFPRLAGLCRDGGHPVLAYGAAPQAELRLAKRTPRAAGQDLVLDILGERHEVLLPLAGAFQAMNALCALGLAIATGAPTAAVAALARLSGVPGRLQLVATGPDGGAVFVDYAHTPDALATVLASLRAHARRRLAVVFGCGGDRDPGKRPLMGRIAAAGADRIYVTDDNPRNEPPEAIRRAILAAVPQAVEIGDRHAAIAAAIVDLGPGDLLLIAGKGHETGQIVGAAVHPFDDAVVARAIARARGWRAVPAEPSGPC